MKPSEKINKIMLELTAKNKPFQELMAMPNNTEKVELVASVACAIQIQAIIDYLDNEYEKD